MTESGMTDYIAKHGLHYIVDNGKLQRKGGFKRLFLNLDELDLPADFNFNRMLQFDFWEKYRSVVSVGDVIEVCGRGVQVELRCDKIYDGTGEHRFKGCGMEMYRGEFPRQWIGQRVPVRLDLEAYFSVHGKKNNFTPDDLFVCLCEGGDPMFTLSLKTMIDQEVAAGISDPTFAAVDHIGGYRAIAQRMLDAASKLEAVARAKWGDDWSYEPEPSQEEVDAEAAMKERAVTGEALQ